MHRLPLNLLVIAALPCLVHVGCGTGDDPLPAEPWDVTAHVRLTADGTRGFPWPLEAEDAIATVRDDDPTTWWKAPLDEPAAVEIDLLPWQGRPVPLHRLSISAAGSGTATLSVDIAAACGWSPIATLAWPDASTPLDLGGTEGGCVTIRVVPDDDFGIASLSIEARARVMPAPRLPDRKQVHPGTGVIEGWYGVPWSWDERESLIRAMAAMGMDTYLYAPKHDWLHRDNWREPYPLEFETRFAALAALGAELGVRIVFGLSPFVDIDENDETDYAIARDKLKRFLDLGAVGIELGSDDAEFNNDRRVDGDLGRAHAGVIQRLLNDLKVDHPDIRVWFMPIAYTDARADDFPDGWAYLQALRDLPPEVDVMWNGLDTFVATITADHLSAVTAAIGRKPVIFDNLWANDAGNAFQARLWLAPQQGRDRQVRDASNGYLHNPMVQGAASRWRIGTFGHWLCETAGNDCGEIEDFAADVELGVGRTDPGAATDRALLRFLAQVFDGHGGGRSVRYRRLDQAFDELKPALASGGELSGEHLWELLVASTALAGTPSESHHSGLGNDLVDELVFPLSKARLTGLAILQGLTVLGQRLSGLESDQSDELLDELVADAGLQRFWLNQGLPDQVAAAVRSVTATDSGFQAPAVADPVPSDCQAGQELAWQPFQDGIRLAVSGLPGAVVDGAVVRFTPGHGGRYQGVVAAFRPAGDSMPASWAWFEFSLACAP